jgi:hypothetical protein
MDMREFHNMLAAFKSDPGRLTAVNPDNFDWELAKLGKEDLRGWEAAEQAAHGGTRWWHEVLWDPAGHRKNDIDARFGVVGATGS